MKGWLLWARYQELPRCAVAAVIATGVMAALVAAASLGGSIDVGPLWISVAMSLPLLFAFVNEHDLDRIAPRSLLARRGALVAITLALTGALSVLTFPGDPQALAAWRNTAALMGWGLLSLTVVPRPAIWVLPTVVALASMLFGWPLEPTLSDGILGALRAPGTLHLESTGEPNLSLLTCGIVWALGAGSYLSGVTLRRPRAERASRGSRTEFAGPGPRSGLGGVALTTPLMGVVSLSVIWTEMASLPFWGGSPRLLLAKDIPSAHFIFMGTAAMAGLVTGQARWRAGVTQWEELSTRSRAELVGRTVGRAARVAAVGLLVPITVLALVAAADLARHVPMNVVLREFAAGWPVVCVVVLEGVVFAAVGAVIGWFSGRAWLAPLWLVAVLALVIATPKPPSQDVDARWAQAYGFESCSRSVRVDVQVCAPAPDAGYVPAALRTVEEIYASSAHPEALPRTVHLVTAGVIPSNVGADGADVHPSVGQSRTRGLTPPDALEGPSAESLAYTTAAWCQGTDVWDLQQLFGVGDGPSNTMPATLASLRDCRAQA